MQTLSLCQARVDMAAYPPIENEHVSCFVTTGDNDFVHYFPPVCSKASIDDLFDILKKVYKVEKIYWRAMNEEQVLDHSLIRQDCWMYDYWQWSRHLHEEIGTEQYGIDAGRQRGIEMWGFTSLFDHGSQAAMHYPRDTGPYMFEWFQRIEHPEWVPIDRYGLRRMAGAVCFEYPEARKALVDMYVNLARRSNYQGILFYLYVEAFHLRFNDEFGFNEPIVNEYKKRYGVDITKQNYDVYALAHMRGEYLTQFFRELKAALQPYGIKVGICLSPNYPQYPQVWMIEPEALNSGRIFVDWRRYIREGLVDEINVWASTKSPYELINEILDEIKETSCKVSTLHAGHFPKMSEYFASRGVIRGMIAATEEFEQGYPDKQPVSALDGDDFIAKLSVLHQMATGQSPVDISKIIAATKDSHIYVRRRAVVTLGAIQASGPEAIAAIEAALDDSEAGVRSYAVDVLAKIGNSKSIDKIYQMLDTKGNFMIRLAATGLLTEEGLSKLPLERTDDLIRGLHHANPFVRMVAVESLGRGTYRPGALKEILELVNDHSPKVRREAARTLRRYGSAEAGVALLNLLDDPAAFVRVMAASSLPSLFDDEAIRSRAFTKLRDMFASYNKAYNGSDADWAWRHVGESLEKTGDDGVEVLNGFLSQNADYTLADHAWQILYVKLSPDKILPITSEQAQAGYEKHPKLRRNWNVKRSSVEGITNAER